ncbi:type II toxin-antitoxin system VapC family toxin [Rathayibacter soli]|uniref:type II toxin-antitoxin system VapC family toxin n=1 Tax=Rathayibacter soli TaxID=3144168 RepID=UPI0027E3E624|nr:type II toxin-antitoxin system VapC family toxin [Glaciibacter superstes]
MIVDTSALVAILRDEPDAAAFAEAIASRARVAMSAASYLEVGVVIDHARSPLASRRVDELIRVAGIQVEAVTANHARIARDAYRDFGKGSGHAAGLDFGDCLSYALAVDRDEALLYKGTDFAHTDIRSALE